MFKNLHVTNHPLIAHKLTIMRKEDTPSQDFRRLLYEISLLLGYEATRDFETEEITIKTPLTEMKAKTLTGKKCAIVPILRAGLGMVDGLLDLIPSARVGHIGLYRDHETHQPIEYYSKLPSDIESRAIIVVDPMLATGGSASDAITMLKKRGAKNIRFVCLVAAPEGVKRLEADHPDVDVYAAALDDCLNENAYILPGLGDAGDRLFGTK